MKNSPRRSSKIVSGNCFLRLRFPRRVSASILPFSKNPSGSNWGLPSTISPQFPGRILHCRNFYRGSFRNCDNSSFRNCFRVFSKTFFQEFLSMFMKHFFREFFFKFIYDYLQKLLQEKNSIEKRMMIFLNKQFLKDFFGMFCRKFLEESTKLLGKLKKKSIF